MKKKENFEFIFKQKPDDIEMGDRLDSRKSADSSKVELSKDLSQQEKHQKEFKKEEKIVSREISGLNIELDKEESKFVDNMSKYFFILTPEDIAERKKILPNLYKSLKESMNKFGFGLADIEYAGARSSLGRKNNNFIGVHIYEPDDLYVLDPSGVQLEIDENGFVYKDQLINLEKEMIKVNISEQIMELSKEIISDKIEEKFKKYFDQEFIKDNKEKMIKNLTSRARYYLVNKFLRNNFIGRSEEDNSYILGSFDIKDDFVLENGNLKNSDLNFFKKEIEEIME